MKVKMNNVTVDMKETVENGVAYLSHRELMDNAQKAGVMFDFPHVNVGNFASVMCVVSGVQGPRCYGTGQATKLSQASDLAYDNAILSLFGIPARSAVELEIAADIALKAEATKKEADRRAAEEARRKAEEDKRLKEEADRRAAEEARRREEEAKRKATQANTESSNSYNYANNSDWDGCHSLTPEDPLDLLVNFGPYKPQDEVTEQKPGPKYLSQIIKYRKDFIEKIVTMQPPTFAKYLDTMLKYCHNHDIALSVTSPKGIDMCNKYGVRVTK